MYCLSEAAQRCQIEVLLRNRAFAVDYASARERWRDGVLPGQFVAVAT